FGESERVVRPVGADLQRVQRHTHVVDRAREGREVIHDIDVTLDLEVLGDVVVDELEVLPSEVLDVLERPGVEVVDADDAEVAADEVVAEGGAGEAGPAGHDGGGHRRDATPRLSTAVAILTRPLHRHPRPRSDSNRSWASASDERYNLLASG